MAKKTKSFFKMSPAERDADVARFDAGIEYKDAAPLTAAQQKRFDRMRKESIAPAAREDQARVLLSIDPKLLVKAHALARREGKTFSALVNDLLRAADRQAG